MDKAVASDVLQVRVWGDYACFTRPEAKAERVTYNVITPSAARGVLEAILWKPEMAWQVREIHVLRPIRYISLLRNEINDKQTHRGGPAKGEMYLADDPENRAQRHTLALRDVAYLIHAQIVLRPHARDPIMKYQEQFLRRLRKGQCFHRPYLGVREFAAHFSESRGDEQPIKLSTDLGTMLFDQAVHPARNGGLKVWVHDENGSRVETCSAEPIFFQARLEDGILRVPGDLYRRLIS